MGIKISKKKFKPNALNAVTFLENQFYATYNQTCINLKQK